MRRLFPLHIFKKLHKAVEAVTDGIKRGRKGGQVFLNAETVVAPFKLIGQEQLAYQTPLRAKGGQVLIKQMAVGLFADVQPQGIVVVLAQIADLHFAHFPGIVHHREIGGPAALLHLLVGDMGFAAHYHTAIARLLVHNAVFGVAEGVATVLHKADLPLQLVGCPQVAYIEEGYPPALRLLQRCVPEIGRTFVVHALRHNEAFIVAFQRHHL